MSRAARRTALLVAATLCAGTEARPQGPPGAIEPVRAAIHAALERGEVPGLAITVVSGDRIVWSAGFGQANRWTGAPVSPSTVFVIGSTYKTLGALALLQQVDAGRIRLDAPLRRLLPELRIDGEIPSRPITVRHLLTHTSGLGNARGAAGVWSDSLPPAPEELLARGVTLEGPTGDTLLYSNLAYLIAGVLVERVTGVPYRRYVADSVFAALGMTATAFQPTPAMEERLATPYRRSPDGGFVPAPRIKAVDYAAGMVYGTAPDLAHWLIANLNGGRFAGRRVLAESTLREMHTRQGDRFLGPRAGGWGDHRTGYGLGWWVWPRDGETLIAHSGSVPGYTAFLAASLDRQVGVVILTNGDRAHATVTRLASIALASPGGEVREGDR